MSGPIRVLHVDDDPDFLELTRTALDRERSNFRVETASDAAAALDRIEEHEFDCVVSDYEMPAVDGIEFLMDVRERDRELPFILFTGKGSEEIASEAISAGVTDYLQKEGGTSQFTVLANRIENAVDRYRARRAAAETERKLTEIAEESDDVLYMIDGGPR